MSECIITREGVRQRTSDGYVCATDLCKAAGKLWGNYVQNKSTRQFINCLSTQLNLSATQIIQNEQGSHSGTWVHPLVATHLAQWISPEFAVKVSIWVARYLAGDITLVQDVLAQHDRVNNTTSATVVNTVSNELLSKEKDIEIRNKLVDLERRELEIASQKTELELKKLELDTKRAELLREQFNQMIHEMQVIETLKKDVHFYTVMKDEFIERHCGKRPFRQPEDDPMLNKDLSTLVREEGINPDSKFLLKLGMEVAREYRMRYANQPPHKIQKLVNGAIRSVNLYTTKDHAWIREIIQKIK